MKELKILKEERFLLLSSPKTGGKLEENQRKTRGNLEENWRKTECISFVTFNGNPGKNEDIESNSNLVSL